MALNLAGIAGAGVALFPNDFDRAAGQGRSEIGKLHFSLIYMVNKRSPPWVGPFLNGVRHANF